ncbi:MAG TPA: pyruvate dehydrogenase (acetyl-transferring) E1 component subunit alpha [Gillisia sp.]|nr:pyruvate dehydrogenase (acetyl-transferring) E1 component subunit alpha [Gillisia sp.]
MENQKKTDPGKTHHLLYQMIMMRKFEEKSAELYTKEKIRGFLHLYVGEEAVATGVMQALKPEDYVLGTYREHAHALARDVDAGAIMAEMYGKQEGCSRGRGGSMHLFDKEKNFFGGNAIVGGHLPLALGMALGSKKLKKENITVCFFGEGAAAEGVFHESLNLAALWKVPVLFVCENNLYAMGTALRFSHAVQEIEKKGPAYGIESLAVDGMDLFKVMEAANKAVDRVRSSGEPYLLVCNTYRFRAHSMFDAELYREKAEVEEWKKQDPIPKFREYLLKENLINEGQLQEIEERVNTEVHKAVDFAEAGTWEPIEELSKYVYTEKPEA